MHCNGLYLQTQFVCIIVHTSVNMTQDCDFPWGFNYSVVAYCVSLVLLFANFFLHSYVFKKRSSAPNFLNGASDGGRDAPSGQKKLS